MMLTQKQFDILVALKCGADSLTQRQLAEKARLSVGTVNKTIAELQSNGLLEGKRLTDAGQSALEPYRVKRAIFIAAGFGSRLIPVTLNTPKPLVRVNGQRIIDSLLDAVLAAGIEEIYIVRGYLSEQFDQLRYKYPMIRFLENSAFNEANNISSMMCCRYLLQNAYVLEADLLLYNPHLITPYQYSSNYLGVPVDMTEDWCFQCEKNRITKLSIGGTNCYHMFGISYWTHQDGARLSEHIEQVYTAPGGKERYWDQVPLEYHIDDYKVAVRPCTFDDIVEIDTFHELQQLDPAYRV